MSSVVLTDSGGVQEEAPSLGKPVLVMRESTERPEGIEASTARLVGMSPDTIIEAIELLARNGSAYRAMARAINPYGDGRAAHRTVQALEFFFGQGPAPRDFVPTPTSEDSFKIGTSADLFTASFRDPLETGAPAHGSGSAAATAR